MSTVACKCSNCACPMNYGGVSAEGTGTATEYPILRQFYHSARPR